MAALDRRVELAAEGARLLHTELDASLRPTRGPLATIPTTEVIGLCRLCELSYYFVQSDELWNTPLSAMRMTARRDDEEALRSLAPMKKSIGPMRIPLPAPKSDQDVHECLRGLDAVLSPEAIEVAECRVLNAKAYTESQSSLAGTQVYRHTVAGGAEEEGRLTVVFRGTADFADMNTDAHLGVVPFPNITWGAGVHTNLVGSYVHGGMWNRLNTDGAEFVARVKDMANTVSEVRITGHSLGGATAVLFGALLAAFGISATIVVVTFGCPRVGDEQFSRTFDALPNVSHWRVVNDLDPFTRVPDRFPRGMTWHHTGNLVWLKRTQRPNEDGRTVTMEYQPIASIVLYGVSAGSSAVSLDLIGADGVKGTPIDLHPESGVRINPAKRPPNIFLHKMGGPKGYIQGLTDIATEGGIARIGGMRHFNAGPL